MDLKSIVGYLFFVLIMSCSGVLWSRNKSVYQRVIRCRPAPGVVQWLMSYSISVV